jgi:peptidase E
MPSVDDDMGSSGGAQMRHTCEHGGRDIFRRHYGDMDCETSHLAFFRQPDSKSILTILTTDFRTRLLEQDAIYVGGGNTKSALAVWREWGLDTVLREAWESGVLLAGMSAGAMCWYEAGLTDSFWGGELIVRSTALVCCPVVAPFTTAATQRDARRYMPR